TDLIQEHRSAAGLLEQAFRIADGAGECAAHVPEQLGFQQRFDDGAAIDRDKRLTPAPAVYCEWPLGNGLQEAENLAALAKQQGVLAVAGLQARAAPSVLYVRDLVRQGYVGEVLSTTLIGSGMGWGPTVE